MSAHEGGGSAPTVFPRTYIQSQGVCAIGRNVWRGRRAEAVALLIGMEAGLAAGKADEAVGRAAGRAVAGREAELEVDHGGCHIPAAPDQGK